MIRHSSSSLTSRSFTLVREVGKNNFVGQGVYCEALEKKLCSLTGSFGCVLTHSGSSAIQLALHVLNYKNATAKKVLISSYVCPSVISAINRENLEPILLDICPDSLNTSFSDINKTSKNEILCIICTNLSGIPDNYDMVYKLPYPVIQDCAQALGARWDGQSLSKTGVISTLSFGSTKLITGGGGGALLTRDKEILHLSQLFAADECSVDHYKKMGFHSGFGEKYSDLNAALVLTQLNELPSFIQKRKKIAESYSKVLKKNQLIRLPNYSEKATPVFYRYYFFSNKSADWIDLLQKSDIDARSSIAHNIIEYTEPNNKLVNLNKNVGQIVSIPIYPSLTDNEVKTILAQLSVGIKKGL